jgi:hypothetical protein
MDERRHFAGPRSRDDIPGAPTGLHRVIDPGPSLALDHLAVGVDLLEDEQLFIERVDHCGSDSVKWDRPQTAAVLQHIAADQAHPALMQTPCLGIKLGKAPFSAILGE